MREVSELDKLEARLTIRRLPKDCFFGTHCHYAKSIYYLGMKLRFSASLLLTAASVLFASAALGAPETYKIDPVHSSITFKVRHLFSYVTGKFTKFDGTFTVDPDATDQATVTAAVQAASIDTADEERDLDLKSADFFDVPKFPEITFKSKSVKPTGKDTADIVGDFTLHGVTKELTLHAQFLGKGKGMKGQISGWHLTSNPIKRSEYGLTWNKAIEGTAVVGDDVEITIDIEADKT
jgi:polyisoprenoid-binding protein YceI